MFTSDQFASFLVALPGFVAVAGFCAHSACMGAGRVVRVLREERHGYQPLPGNRPAAPTTGSGVVKIVARVEGM